MERVLVTGGAGYIGSMLVPELLRAGYRVTVVDNFLYRQNSLAQLCHDPRLEIVGADVRDEAQMAGLLKEADVVIPLAALVGAPLCAKDPVAATSVNRDAPLSMFKRLSPSQRVLMPTTNSGYGKGDPGVPVTEESPQTPLSLYARHKVEVERALLEREASISFRLATVFGMSPRLRLDLLVNDFVYRAVTDRFVVLFEPHFKRNYIHVLDVVRLFVFGIQNFDRLRGQIYNAGLSDANLSKADLCDEIRRVVPAFVSLVAPVGEDPDKRDYIVSNQKLERTGFKTTHSLQDGIRELVKGYRGLRNTRFGNV